jgi:peptide deformylase
MARLVRRRDERVAARREIGVGHRSGRDAMAARTILLLGNPVLREACTPIRTFGGESLRTLAEDLRDTLADFRTRRGFGRGIAAPQIGVPQRVLFIDAGEPIAMVNPVIVRRSRNRILLWDDCFSFPDLLVKVKRHLMIDVRYRDLYGRAKTLRAEGGMSELLQHEIDHLDGVLALDRAIDSRHIVYRSEVENREARTAAVIL